MSQPKSYGTRGVAEPHNHSIYTTYIKALGLKDSERMDLLKRGLNEEQINRAQYSTKQINTALDTSNALGILKTTGVNLDNVPGFFVDDKTGHNDQCKVSGLTIPVRDMNGHIASLLIRNDKAKVDKDGKLKNKYLPFSSAGKTKGNKVRQTTHCPIVKGKARECDSTSIRITEGVLKSDVATALGDKYCLGMQGLNIQDDLPVILVELEIQELIISIDAGEDDSFDILRCKARLIKICRDIGIDFKIECWDAKFGKGIDDVLKSGNADKIRFLKEDEIEALLDKANEADFNNGDWVYNIHDQLFVNIMNGQLLSKGQFVDKFRLVKAEAANMVIGGNFRQVDKTTFLPNGDTFINEDGLKCLNIWQNPQTVPLEGNIDIFMNHVKLIFPDEFQRNILFDWLAFNIQFPGIKILWALLIIGDEGIGKSFFGHIMKKILGERNVGFPTMEELHEPYTAWQKNKQLIVVEEMMAKGKVELMNKLKPIITQPTTQIREMRMTSYSAYNRFNILSYTNHDDALLINDKDRRYGIIKSMLERLSPEYYQMLWDWIKEKRNLQSVHHFFMFRDISKFNPNAAAPETQAKRDMVSIGKSSLEEWISDGVALRTWPFNRDILNIPHLKDKRVCPNGFEKISNYRWAQALRKSGASQYGNDGNPVKLSNKSMARMWIIGDQKQILLNSTPTEIAKLYENTPLDYNGLNPTAQEKFDNVLNFNPSRDEEPI